MNWLKDNLPWLIPIAITLLTTIANRLQEGEPKHLIGIVVDVLSLLPRKGMKGNLGPISLPLTPSQPKTAVDPLDLPPPPKAGEQ